VTKNTTHFQMELFQVPADAVGNRIPSNLPLRCRPWARSPGSWEGLRAQECAGRMSGRWNSASLCHVLLPSIPRPRWARPHSPCFRLLLEMAVPWYPNLNFRIESPSDAGHGQDRPALGRAYEPRMRRPHERPMELCSPLPRPTPEYPPSALSATALALLPPPPRDGGPLVS
jgi:hypothetical protein